MALTAGTTQPFAPYSGGGGHGQAAKNVMQCKVAASQTIAVGDVLTMASGQVSVNNAAATLIVGVAIEAITTTASPTDDDVVALVPALPGQLFVGSFVTNTTTDITDPAYADLTQGAAGKDIAEGPDGFPVIIDATTNDVVYLIAFMRGQNRGTNFVAGAGGTTNPRVIFQFNPGETIFEATSV